MFCTNCGGQNADSATTCVTCGKALQAPAGVLRMMGDQLVIPRGAVLPPYCVRCGQPADGYLKKTFAWHQPWLYLLILLHIILYAIVAAIVSKKLPLEVPLCAAHRNQRKLRLTLGWVLLAGCIPLGVMIGMSGPDMEAFGFLAGLVAFIASLVFFVLGTRVMSPKLIDDREGRFGGVSPVFIQIALKQPAAAAGR
jgi:hypothetical protein